MQLSQKRKIFVNFLLKFWNVNVILDILTKKGDLQRFCISEITDSGNVVR